MKKSPRPSLLPVMNRSSLSFGGMLVVALAFDADLFAATPVDLYQGMESGNNGDLLTAALAGAASHPGGKWTMFGSMWVSNKHADLPGPVTAGGTTYSGTGSTRTWMYNCNKKRNCTEFALPRNGCSNITVACYYTTNSTITNTTQYDTIIPEKK